MHSCACRVHKESLRTEIQRLVKSNPCQVRHIPDALAIFTTAPDESRLCEVRLDSVISNALGIVSDIGYSHLGVGQSRGGTFVLRRCTVGSGDQFLYDSVRLAHPHDDESRSIDPLHSTIGPGDSLRRGETKTRLHRPYSMRCFRWAWCAS